MAFGELRHRSFDIFDIAQSRPLDSYMSLRSIFHVEHDVLDRTRSLYLFGVGWVGGGHSWTVGKPPQSLTISMSVRINL